MDRDRTEIMDRAGEIQATSNGDHALTWAT